VTGVGAAGGRTPGRPTHYDVPQSVIDTLWELRDHIDDSYVYGWITGWLECAEGVPPYSAEVEQ
jgi:hypothetical protein